MRTTKEQVGANLKTIRIMKGMLNREVSVAIGRNKCWLTNLEKGKIKATLKVDDLIKLCELYECTPNDIFYLHEKLGS